MAERMGREAGNKQEKYIVRGDVSTLEKIKKIWSLG